MKKKKILKKGYTVEVVSWENDGDNYRTESFTYASEEYAKAVAKLCNTVFKSKNNGKGGIGNSSNQNEETDNIILKFMRVHPILSDNKKDVNAMELIDICMDINYNLLGGSEYYYSRVCEKVSLYFVDKDIEVEEIKF